MLLNELISSKIQLKWVQEVRAHLVLRYSAREYVEVECVQRIDFVDDQVVKLTIFSYGQPKGKSTVSKGYKAPTMLETSNPLQKEPQQAGLNMRREVISRPPRPVFICRVGTCGFISR